MDLFASERKKGIVGTSVLHLVILAFLFVAGISATKPPEPGGGIMVNFGTDETGSGEIEPSAPVSLDENSQPVTDATAKTVLPKEVTRAAVEERMLTQNYDKEAPLVKKVDPDAEKKKKEQIETERIRREQLAAERKRIAEEDAKRKQAEAEQQRSADIFNRTRNAFANARNSGTSSTGEGITGGTGNQGVTSGFVGSKVRGDGSGTGTSGSGTGSGTGSGSGNGTGNGPSYDLGGRGFQSLPDPKYDYQGEGKVVVEISVDRSGNVTEATPGIKGSTTLDEYLLATAKEAAMSAKFAAKPDAPLKQKGTITYNFKLK